MSVVVLNQTASAVEVSDVGARVPASGSLAIDPQDYQRWAFSATGGLAETLVNAGTLRVQVGGITLTNAAQCLQALRFAHAINMPFRPGNAGFTSLTVQNAIEEAKTSAEGKARFAIVTTFNGVMGNNQWLGYSELIPGDTVPIILPRDCILKEITWSWQSIIVGSMITGTVDGRFDLYKNGLVSPTNVIFQRTFTNSPPAFSANINIAFAAGDFMVGRWVDQGDNPSDAAITYFFQTT